MARQQFAKVLTIGRHRHSESLFRGWTSRTPFEDLAPCPVLEVAAETDPRASRAPVPGEAVAERHCTVCGRSVDAVVCPECGLRIAGELLTSQRQYQRMEGRGLHPEDKSLAVNPLPGDRGAQKS